jgi:hypothetical protein
VDEAALVRRVSTLVDAHPAVKSVALIGSQQRGDSTRWSDWDFKVQTDDFTSVAQALPSLIAPIQPLAAQWDRLSDHQCYMVIVEGPRKVDLLFDEPHTHEPPHLVSATTLAAIDDHFWDWTLWLTSKVAAGKLDVVRSELAKMTDHLLGPLGIRATPTTLLDAVDAYVAARADHEKRFEVEVARELGSQVERVIRTQGPV